MLTELALSYSLNLRQHFDVGAFFLARAPMRRNLLDS
jgi:hypothetical protein